jgi:hypothetical protein
MKGGGGGYASPRTKVMCQNLRFIHLYVDIGPLAINTESIPFIRLLQLQFTNSRYR